MGTTDPMTRATPSPPPGRLPGGGPAALARAVALEPLSLRARRELLFSLIGIPLGFSVVAVLPFCVFLPALVLVLVAPRYASTWVAAVAIIPAALLVVLLATRVGRRLGVVHRGLAAWLLGERVAAPPPPPTGRLAAGLRDGPGWRAVAYQLLKLPVAVLDSYAANFWLGGLVNLTYPFWWGLFRNHPPGVRLSPVPAASPFPGRVLHVTSFAGTFGAFAVGAAMVLAAPWVTRAVVAADRWLIRTLLGPGTLTQRVRDLEQTRALAVDDAAARLRRVERDLHDGAQMRLATLAMNLGMAREKLGDDGEPVDVGRARELLDAAHRGAKEALVELRDLAKGIHPPVLDNGLGDALATLAATSAIPVELHSDLPRRPTPAIETIAYFCAAELLANAAKHSFANTVRMQATEHDGQLLLAVGDDGVGGADPARGSGLSGLAQRVRTVDGRLRIASPPGGPTRVTVELPLRP
ncbi:MAG TPA: sensor domain-containing protein [Actinomycetes bacterium]